MEIKFLGTADSGGIPVHNCLCNICEDYRAKKIENLATCAYIQTENKEIILLDAGVENISSIFDKKTIKAVMMTHFHPDHALGLLRLRYSKDSINCYHPKDENGFSDLFKHKKAIIYHENAPFEKIKINEIEFTPVPLRHSKNTTGYLIESKNKTIAYLTDCAGVYNSSMDFLKSKNIDECYIDAGLSPNLSKGNHLHFEEATKILDEIGAKKSFLIHSSHTILNYIQEHNIKLKYSFI